MLHTRVAQWFEKSVTPRRSQLVPCDCLVKSPEGNREGRMKNGSARNATFIAMAAGELGLPHAGKGGARKTFFPPSPTAGLLHILTARTYGESVRDCGKNGA